jgi:hypothetical protein
MSNSPGTPVPGSPAPAAPAQAAPAAPAGGGGGFNIAEPQMTAAQFQNQQEFFFAQVERFKKMFEDSTLAKFIIMAGVSGVVIAVVEAARGIIDLVNYFRK